MFASRIVTIAAALAAMTTMAFAETKDPAKAAKHAPAAAPAAPAPAKAAAPVAAKVNLNSANATELDALPQIGPARAKAIIEARAKGKFKDWDDFVKRKVVPSNAEAAIKDKVSF
jgi:competence protein ComEA